MRRGPRGRRPAMRESRISAVESAALPTAMVPIAESRRSTARVWIPRGQKRCATSRWLMWIGPWTALLLFGLYSAGLCLVKGLNQTNMDNRFPFGLWIFLDLTVIALGAGAFLTGFLLYILKLKELGALINSAVVIGFVCYSGAVA